MGKEILASAEFVLFVMEWDKVAGHHNPRYVYAVIGMAQAIQEAVFQRMAFYKALVST